MKIEFEKWFLSFHGPPPHFWPASRSRPNDPPRAVPLPRPSPPRALASFFPRARVRVRPRQACRAAWRAHAVDADRVASCGPREHAPRPFSSPIAPILPALLIFLSHAASLPRPAPSSARAALATAAPPAKLAAGGPPSPTIMRTSLRLALRHPVLAAGSPFEQGKATLSGFAAVGHGAAALDLAVERASPFLLYPLESPSRVRHLLADPVRAPSCPVVAGNGRRPAGSCRAAMAPGTPAWRGRLPSALCWARLALGHSPEQGLRSFPSAWLLRPKAIVGQSFSWAGPVVIGKMFSVFLLLFGKRNTLENVCVLIFAPKMVK